MENHDEAYHIWRDSGLQQRILVHIDAHDDMHWTDQATSIANFICPALKEDLVREVYWVIPTQNWQTPKSLRRLRRRLKKIAGGYPGASSCLKVGSHQISTALLGKPIMVCSLDNLPHIEEEVLLDIDVDFLVLANSFGESLGPETLPWCWPKELLTRLEVGHLRPVVTTIAYSVEGGYTPLKWKYLGDELALRLGGNGGDPQSLQGMRLMREAALAADRGDLAAAENYYQEAGQLLPASAAPPFHLALLYLDMGKTRRAQDYYQRALALDMSYRTAYNSAGLQFYQGGRFREAAHEFRRTLALDPEDPHALLGMGRLAARGKHWREAEAWLRKSLVLKPVLLDAYRALGEVLARQGRRQEAIAAYEKSLMLALKGHQPLTEAIATGHQGLLDPDHFSIHGRLARLYELQGETVRAINSYRMSIAKDADCFGSRVRLARLYLKQRQWRKSAQEAGWAATMVPQVVRKTGRRLRRALKQALRGNLSASFRPPVF